VAGRRRVHVHVEPALPPVPATTAVAGQAGRWLQEERGEALGVEALGVEAVAAATAIFGLRVRTRASTTFLRLRVSSLSAAAVPHRGTKEARCATACRGTRAATPACA